MRKCENCGAAYRPGQNYCRYCGCELEQPEAPARTVPQQVTRQAPQPAPQPVVRQQIIYQPVQYVERYSDRSRVLALVLCLLLGEFGVHRFYQGKIGTGILWLLSFGLFGFGWLVDLLTLVFGHPTDGQGRLMRWS